MLNDLLELNIWKKKGYEETSTSKLYAKQHFREDSRWIIKIYKPVDKKRLIESISKIEKFYNLTFSDELKMFYQEYNGVNMFVGSLQIYGFKYSDTDETEVLQNYKPEFIEMSASDSLAFDIPTNWLNIGIVKIDYDKSAHIYYDGNNNNFCIVSLDSTRLIIKRKVISKGTYKLVKEFNSLSDLLLYSYNQLLKKYYCINNFEENYKQIYVNYGG